MLKRCSAALELLHVLAIHLRKQLFVKTHENHLHIWNVKFYYRRKYIIGTINVFCTITLLIKFENNQTIENRMFHSDTNVCFLFATNTNEFVCFVIIRIFIYSDFLKLRNKIAVYSVGFCFGRLILFYVSILSHF